MDKKLTKKLWNRIKNKEQIIHLLMGGTENEPDTHDFDVENGTCKKCGAKIWEEGNRLCSVISNEEFTL